MYAVLLLTILVSGCLGGSQKTKPLQALTPTDGSSKSIKSAPEAPQWRYLSSHYLGSDYTIGPEDILDIKVFDAAEFDRTIRVSNNGYFTYPLLGIIRAEGLTPEELEFNLAALLGERFLKNPQVSVYIREHHSKKVTVVGEVESPQVLELTTNRSTLFEILGKAGGLTEKAGRTLYVIRPVLVNLEPEEIQSVRGVGGEGEIIAKVRDEITPVNILELMEYRNPMSNVEIRPGDIVSVPRSELFFILGEIDRPGAYQLGEGLTAIQALSHGGKLTSVAASGDIWLIRRQADGSQVTVSLDLKKISLGEEDDVPVEPGDILLVGKSTAKQLAHQSWEIAKIAAQGFSTAFFWEMIRGDSGGSSGR